MDIADFLQKERKVVNKALIKNLPAPTGPSKELIQAMRYSVSAGGKRLRPVLMLAVAQMLGKPAAGVLQAACAIEYIHTLTLILDDLPCMDDSVLRRGRPSVHKRFGESTAILAAYSLMALAFELMAENSRATEILSKAIGSSGVCAGQYLDLASGSGKISAETLKYLHRHKTADLFAASCMIAACLSGANDIQKKALGRYGEYLGMAFQIYDDMLSIKKTDKELGKQTKKDRSSPNLVNLFGFDRSRQLLNYYVTQAESQLSIFKAKAGLLKQILKYSVNREK